MSPKNQIKKAKNYRLLLKKSSVPVLAATSIWIVIALFLQKPAWSFSALLGAGFSFLVLKELMVTNEHMAQVKSKRPFYPRFLLRLGLYAAPMALSGAFPTYFNFNITLVFLFSFQAAYIGSELIRVLTKLKTKRSNT